ACTTISASSSSTGADGSVAGSGGAVPRSTASNVLPDQIVRHDVVLVRIIGIRLRARAIVVDYCALHASADLLGNGCGHEGIVPLVAHNGEFARHESAA